MSTATLPQSQTIGQVVNRARVTLYLAGLVMGCVTWTILSGITWLGLFWLDNLLRLPVGLRFPLALVGGIVTLVGLWTFVIQRLRDWKTPGQVAVLLEKEYGIGENVLINSLQFAQIEYGAHQQPYIEETIGAGALGLAAVSLRDLWQPVRLGKWGFVLAMLLGLWLGYASLAPRHAGNAFDRYLYSLADVPPVGSVELTVTPSDGVKIAERDDLQVTVEVDGLEPGARLASYPELFWKEGTAGVESQPGTANRVVMQPLVGQSATYTHTFVGVRRDFAFRVFARDSYTRSIQVTVLPAPGIAEAQFHLTPPAYVGTETTTHMGPPHAIGGLPGSKLGIEIKLDQAAKALRWRNAGEVIEFTEKDGRWRADTTIQTAASYEVEVEGHGLNRGVIIASGVLSLLADRPPQVEFVQPAMNWTVMPGERVPLRLRAEDDHGIKEIAVVVRSAFGGSPPVTVKTWTSANPPGRKGNIEEPMDLAIDASLFAPGGKYLVEAFCSDFCPGNSPAVSRPVLIDVKSLDKLAMPPNANLGDVYSALDRAIASQKRALDATRTLTNHIDDVWLNLSGRPREDVEIQKLQDAHRTQILNNQRDVRTALLSVALKGTVAPAEKRLFERLRELGQSEATQANDRAFALTQPAVVSGTFKPVQENFRLAGITEPQKISFSPTRARYVGLVVRSIHGWQDRMHLQGISFSDIDGEEKSPGSASSAWKVIASRGGEKIAESFPQSKAWQAAGQLPYYLVIDLGAPRTLDGLALSAVPWDGSLGPKDIQVYLGATMPPALSLVNQTKARMIAELGPLERLEEAIYNELVALKGQEARKAEKEKDLQAKKALGETIESAPSVKENIKKFLDELKDWTKVHENNAENRKSIMDKPAQDFSEKDAAELGQLTLDKRKLARKLEDMIGDLANAGAMDFGDARQAKTLAKLMDKANDLKDLADLAAYKAEMFDYTYNLDNALTSQAKEITKGTEDTTFVDPTPGSGESPEDKKALPYLQEIPTELAVTVPELKQKLDDYYEKVKQAGLSLANSVEDSDGPIAPSIFSGTSAAGKMGDATPDQKMDRTGRSNIGRTGKSDGQMVGNSAPPIKDDQVMIPERMSNSPLEGGKVDDKSGTDATSQGLGKSTNGLTEFGRSGKLPPEMYKKLKQVQRQAEDVRSSAQDLVLKLQRHNLPTADLKMAIHRFDQANQALNKGNGVGLRLAYQEAVASLQAAQQNLVEQLDRRQVARTQQLKGPRDLSGPGTEADPRGYEDIIGAYFRQIAERK